MKGDDQMIRIAGKNKPTQPGNYMYYDEAESKWIGCHIERMPKSAGLHLRESTGWFSLADVPDGLTWSERIADPVPENPKYDDIVSNLATIRNSLVEKRRYISERMPPGDEQEALIDLIDVCALLRQTIEMIVVGR